MRKRSLNRIIYIGVTIAVLFSFIILGIGRTQVEASSKKAFYFTSLTGEKNNKRAEAKSVSISGNKLIVKGSFEKAPSKKKFFDRKTKFIKYGKKTFKLKNGCRFYLAGGVNGPKKVSKKVFLKTARCYNGLALCIYVDASGKVYKAVISS